MTNIVKEWIYAFQFSSNNLKAEYYNLGINSLLV